MSRSPKSKHDILHELFDGRLVGGTLSELASYADLFKRMSESVFLLDRHSFRVLECNGAALALLEREESEILGVELPVLLHSGEELGARLREGFLPRELSHHTDRGDERIFEISATPLKILDYIEVIQFIARDITEVRRAERELREMNEVLRTLSTTDEMTRLKNYRYFKEVLQAVHHHAEGANGEYGLIFVDVDHFKKFNDRNGHPAGDALLLQIAGILLNCARSQDLPARYGGEEFVVLCRNSSLDETAHQAEVIRGTIERTGFPFGEFQPLGKISVSIGVSGFPGVQGSYEEVLQSADQALYGSKEQGRNRVTLFQGVPGAPLHGKKKAS